MLDIYYQYSSILKLLNVKNHSLFITIVQLAMYGIQLNFKLSKTHILTANLKNLLTADPPFQNPGDAPGEPVQGRTIGFCLGGGAKYFKLRNAFLTPSVWGQSYQRGGQTFVTFFHHELVISVVLAQHFFENSESQ